MPQSRPRSAKSANGPAKATRGGGPKALADSLRKVTRQALGQRSLAEQSLILDWPSIAGGDVARMCTPQSLSFQHRDRRMDGILTLKVQSSQATRLQHLEPQLIERINGYFGYRAIARLRLLHGAAPASGEPDAQPEAPAPAPHSAPHPAPHPAPHSAPHGEQADEPIADPALRAALARLGRAVKPPHESGT